MEHPISLISPPVISRAISPVEYVGHECVYLVQLNEMEYKYGMTGDLPTRVDTHVRTFTGHGCNPILIAAWRCTGREVARAAEPLRGPSYRAEGRIKDYAANCGISRRKYDNTELLCIRDIVPVIVAIGGFVHSATEALRATSSRPAAAPKKRAKKAVTSTAMAAKYVKKNPPTGRDITTLRDGPRRGSTYYGTYDAAIKTLGKRPLIATSLAKIIMAAGYVSVGYGGEPVWCLP